MSLETKIIALAQAIGTDVKGLGSKQGDLTALSTTAKNTLVAAINELYQSLSSSTQINDAAGDGDTTATWSANKIYDLLALKAALSSPAFTGSPTAPTATSGNSTTQLATTAFVQSAVAALVGGAPGVLDTLDELAAALGNDPNFATIIATGLTNRVRFDASQTLSAAQQLLACTNIGVGDPEHSFAADYATAKA